MSDTIQQTDTQEQVQERTPGVLPPGGADIWNRYMEYLFGKPEPYHAVVIQGQQFNIMPSGAVLNAAGKDTGIRVANGQIINTDGSVIGNIGYESGKLYGTNGITADLQTVEQPSYLSQALKQRNEYRQAENDRYVQSLQDLEKPVSAAMDDYRKAEQGLETAIDVAKQRPVKFYWQGKPVGNVMMQGGMDAEDRRMNARGNLVQMEQGRMANKMAAPAARYDFSQKQTPYDPFMEGLNLFQNAGMGVQGLAYGIPTTSSNITTTSTADVPEYEKPTESKIADYINYARLGAEAIGTLGSVYDAIDRGIDAVANWSIWD
jgi:hypothetical protein